MKCLAIATEVTGGRTRKQSAIRLRARRTKTLLQQIGAEEARAVIGFAELFIWNSHTFRRSSKVGRWLDCTNSIPHVLVMINCLQDFRSPTYHKHVRCLNRQRPHKCCNTNLKPETCAFLTLHCDCVVNSLLWIGQLLSCSRDHLTINKNTRVLNQPSAEGYPQRVTHTFRTQSVFESDASLSFFFWSLRISFISHNDTDCKYGRCLETPAYVCFFLHVETEA